MLLDHFARYYKYPCLILWYNIPLPQAIWCPELRAIMKINMNLLWQLHWLQGSRRDMFKQQKSKVMILDWGSFFYIDYGTVLDCSTTSLMPICIALSMILVIQGRAWVVLGLGLDRNQYQGTYVGQTFWPFDGVIGGVNRGRVNFSIIQVTDDY